MKFVLGERWHGFCETHMTPENQNEMLGDKTMHQLYQETMYRLEILKCKYDKVVYIWDCQWTREKKSNSLVIDFLEKFNFGPKIIERQMSEKRMLELILEKKIHGIVEVDINTPLELQAPFPKGHGDFP